MPAPAHISQEFRFGTSYEKCYQNQGNTVFILTSQKTEIAKSVKRPKITRALCRKRTGEALPRAEKFGDLITADQSVKVVNLETIIDTLSLFKILPLNGFNPVRAKQNLHM